jgi:hypothetical protein
MSETGPYHPGEESFHPLESIKLGPYRRGGETLHLQSPSMSWGVYDFTTLTAISFSADGGHFTSVPGRRYLVTLRVEDTLGIEKVTLDGSGKFEAWTDDDPAKQTGTHKAPELLPASIQHQEFDNRGMAPQLQSLIVIMNPDIGAWEYDRLSCGVHAWSGVQEEYFAVSGLMTFSGTSSNVVGRSSSASLTTSP